MSAAEDKPNQGESGTDGPRMKIPEPTLVDFCRRHHLRKLALFGSVLRDDFSSESDIDVLVEFEAGHGDLFLLTRMEEELSEVFKGHKVDVNTPRMLNRYFRDEVLKEAEVLYDQT